MDMLFKPTPHEEAIALLRNKPAVTRDVFEKLSPELRARAFTVSGIENMDTLQRLRDKIARLPEGVPWDEVKADVLQDVLPYFVDPDASEEDQAGQTAAAARRSELLVRHHGFQAYATTQHVLIQETKDALPYLQYWSMGDGRVRESHAALDTTVLRVDSPFWDGHYPPWEWSCRCMVTQLTDEDVADMRAEDSDKAPEAQRVIEGVRLERLQEQGRISLGPSSDVDVSPPEARGGSYRFQPQHMQIPFDQITERYEPEVLSKLTTWAESVDLGDGRSLWDWMQRGQS